VGKIRAELAEAGTVNIVRARRIERAGNPLELEPSLSPSAPQPAVAAGAIAPTHTAAGTIAGKTAV